MPRRIDRRTFLQVSAGAALAGVAYGTLGVRGVQPRPKPSGPRRVLTKEFHLGPAELSRGSRSGLTVGPGGLKLGRGRSSGRFLSPVLKSDILFDYVGLFWSGEYPGGNSVAFWVRTSPDGSSWSPWQTVQVETPPGPLAEYDTYGALIWADRANYVQFLGGLRGASEKPGVSRIGLTLLNPYDGPIVGTGADLSDGGFANAALAAEADSYTEIGAAAVAASGKPVTFKREDWGADESLRFSGGQEIWPRSYVPTKKLVIHHTATGNSYSTVEDAKAQVRAIYAYHASTRGWGDIGYNSLVDRFGNSYEGRRGRDGPGYDGPGGREILSEDVVGGHATSHNHGSSGIALMGTFDSVSPSSAALSRLRDILAWEYSRHGINPRASTDFLKASDSWNRGLANVCGHRDTQDTACPGSSLYALLPGLRSDTAYRLSQGWSAWEKLGAPSGLSLTSDPSVVSWSDGRIDVFARASDDGLWHKWYVKGQGWSAWENLGGTLRSGPDVSSWAEGRLDVFALGTDNKLRHKWYVRGQGWSAWEKLGAPSGLTLTGDPGVVSWGGGRIDVFARGSDDSLWHKWYVRGQGWFAWENLGGTLRSGPDVSSWAEGRLDVFALGTDNKLRHKWHVKGQGWSAWEKLGAPSGLTLTGDPGVVSWGGGRIDVFARASDDGLWHKWYVKGQGWFAWENLGGALRSGPDVSSWAEGRLDVFALGTDNKLRHKWYNTLAPTVSITSAPPQGTRTDPNVSYAWQGSGGWGAREYSYYLEGWSLDSNVLVVYHTGFNAAREPAWGAWTTATQASFALDQPGHYTFHVRARDSRGRLSVFEDNRTLLADMATSGLTLASDPSAVSWGDERIDVFARASDDGLWHKWYVRGQGWFAWENLGGTLRSGPDVSSWAEGRLDVFALGTDNKLRHKWYVRGQGWSAWENLGAPSGLSLASDPSVVSWSDGRIDVFARGSDDGLWHKWYVRGQGWFAWENLGGTLRSGPDVSSWAEGRLDVFALGTDNKLRHKWYVSGQGWSAWEKLGVASGLTLTGGPGVVSWGDGRIDVFARGSNDGLWHKWYVKGQGWFAWENLGGTLSSGPDVSSWAEGRLDVFALGTDDRLRHKWYVSGQGWSAWENLGAPS